MLGGLFVWAGVKQAAFLIIEVVNLSVSSV